MRRGIGLLAVAAVAVATVGPLGTSTLSPAGAAAVDEPEARTVVAACDGAPRSPFRDVAADHAHRSGIDCVAWWRVAGGFPDGSYRPGQAVTRAQMATFVSTAILATGSALPAPGRAFGDSAGTHQRGIERLAAAGIVGGFGDGTFRPTQPVTRGQMATFLANAAAHVLGRPLTDQGADFPDVAGDAHELAIRRIASHGIASGDRDGNYRPGDPVTRGQLGSFVARLLTVLVEDGQLPVRGAAAAVDDVALEAAMCRFRDSDVHFADRLMAGYYQWSPHREVHLGTDLTWREDPLGDANWRFQFHALRWLWALIGATEQTGDARYLDHASAMARDWVRDNPPAAPAAPVAWDDHAAAFRAMVFTCLAMHLPTVPDWLSASLDLHRTMLADPSFYVLHKGNHALNQDIGMLGISCRTEAWQHRDLAVERITRLVTQGVDHQGVMDEQAVEYQDYNYGRYRAAMAAIRACGVAMPSALGRVDLMPEVLAHMTLPDGTYETLGDTDRRQARDIDHPATRWMHTQGEDGTPPSRTFVVYDAGFVFARSGWGTDRPFGADTFLSGRFGPRPILHGHDDHGSLTLFADGQRLITDPGKYAYNNDAERRHVRSRAAHNVVTVGPADCPVPDQPSRISRVRSDAVADRFVLSVRVCTGMTWDRHVAFLRDGGEVVVVDEVSAPAGTPIAQRWQLELGAEVAGTAQRLRASWPSGARLLVEQLGTVDGVTVVAGGRDPLRGWVSLRYGDLQPAANVAYTAPASGTATRFVTVLRPGVGGDAPASVAAGSGGEVRVTVPTAAQGEVTVRFP